MEILLSTLIMLLILGACMYQRTSLFTSLAALTFTMLALSLFGPVGFFGWALYLAAVVVLCMPSVRQSLISGKALAVFKKVLPAMSQTEKEALEAGTVWWNPNCLKASRTGKSCTISKLRSCLLKNKPSWMAQSMKCVLWLATTKSPMNWQIYRQKCGLSSKRRNSSP